MRRPEQHKFSESQRRRCVGAAGLRITGRIEELPVNKSGPWLKPGEPVSVYQDCCKATRQAVAIHSLESSAS
uniref:NfeD domain-containing protein n=1 Tax=Rodentolepis nana TaxID=102285 RepID=A0A0R3TTU2_RODNA